MTLRHNRPGTRIFRVAGDEERLRSAEINAPQRLRDGACCARVSNGVRSVFDVSRTADETPSIVPWVSAVFGPPFPCFFIEPEGGEEAEFGPIQARKRCVNAEYLGTSFALIGAEGLRKTQTQRGG
jgi:hypothetical protein